MKHSPFRSFILVLIGLSILFGFPPDSSLADSPAIQTASSNRTAYQIYKRYGVKRLRAEKKSLKKKIKKYKRKAENALVTNISRAANFLEKANKAESLLAMVESILVEKLRYGQCPPANSKMRIVIENDSEHSLSALYSYGGTVKRTTIGTGENGILKIKFKMSEMEADEHYYLFTIQLVARINGANVVWSDSIESTGWKSKKKPCIFKLKYRLTNRHFPAPKLTYAAFGVDLGSNRRGTIYVGSESVLKNIPRCKFKGGGLDCTIFPKYWNLSGRTYNTIEEAQQDMCRGVVFKNIWNGSSCGRWFQFRDGKTYWGCEPTVNTAVNNYCSKFNGPGKVFGTIVK